MIAVYIVKDGHHVDVLMTKKRILQIKYHAHPGLGTHALGILYYTAIDTEYTPCVCADFADSLCRGLYSQALVVLEAHIYRMPDRKTLTMAGRPERLDLLQSWCDMSSNKYGDRRRAVGKRAHAYLHNASECERRTGISQHRGVRTQEPSDLRALLAPPWSGYASTRHDVHPNTGESRQLHVHRLC